jgi:hypothetical protein
MSTVTQVAGLLEKGRKGQKIASIVMGMTLCSFGWMRAMFGLTIKTRGILTTKTG